MKITWYCFSTVNNFILDVCTGAGMSVYTCRSEVCVRSLPLAFFPLLSETRPLTEPDTQVLAYNGWPVRPRICLWTSPRAGLQTCVDTPSFYRVLSIQTRSGPPACTGSTLAIRSPSPFCCLFTTPQCRDCLIQEHLHGYILKTFSENASKMFTGWGPVSKTNEQKIVKRCLNKGLIKYSLPVMGITLGTLQKTCYR